jgi:Domain of unknown function (DUF6134)
VSQLRPDRKRSAISRRQVLKAGVAGAISCAVPAIALAQTSIVMPAATDDRHFSVIYKGSKIGTHTILYSTDTGETHITTNINLSVTFLGATMFAYRHRSEEIWRDCLIMSLKSETLESGETLVIEGAAITDGFRVVSKDGPFIASAATLTSNSQWTPVVLGQETVVDAGHGGIIGISAHKVGDEQFLVAGQEIPTTRYKVITPFLAGDIWYDENNLWVGGEFESKGKKKYKYQLDM